MLPASALNDRESVCVPVCVCVLSEGISFFVVIGKVCPLGGSLGSLENHWPLGDTKVYSSVP